MNCGSQFPGGCGAQNLWALPVVEGVDREGSALHAANGMSTGSFSLVAKRPPESERFQGLPFSDPNPGCCELMLLCLPSGPGISRDSARADSA